MERGHAVDFDAAFEAECRRCERAGVPLSLILFETAADRVEERVRSCFGRPGDRLAPVSGSRYVVLLPFTSAQGAAVVAERMRSALNAAGFTLTAGTSSQIPSRAAGIADYFEAAGKRLERALAHGGDCVEAAHGDAPRKPRVQHNLPAQRTSFVGRAQDVANVRSLLQSEHLVTLLGPGGAGKTRTAVEALSALVDEFEDGVWFLDVTRTHDLPGLMQFAASTAGFGALQDGDIERFATLFRERSMVLVFDNCEQLLGDCRSVVNAFLTHAPGVKMLVTSRQALGIPGERVYRLPMLDTADGVQLFLDRAAQAGLDVRDRRPAIERIVRTLDGMPLAIELAAARLDAMSIDDLAASLDDCLNVLHEREGSRPTRQQTLRALIDWSYDLLNDREKRLFRRLAIFPASWSRDAVQPVTAEDPQTLDALLAKSLVLRVDYEGRARYRFLHVTHGYAERFLDDAGERDEMLDRLSNYFAGLAAERGRALATMPMRVWLALRLPERENLILSLRYLLERRIRPEQIEVILESLRHWMHERGAIDFGELLPQFETVLGRAEFGDGVVAAVALAASDIYATRDLRRSREVAERALKLYREINDGVGAAHALERFATAQRYLEGGVDSQLETPIRNGVFAAKRSGDKRLAAFLLRTLADVYALKEDEILERAVLLEAYELLRESGDDDRSGGMLGRLAVSAFWSGDYEEARSISYSAISLLEKTGEPWNLAFHLMNLGLFETFAGNYDAARANLRRSLELLRRYGHEYGIANTFANLAILSRATDNAERAVRLMAYADSLFASGPRQQRRLEQLHDDTIAQLRQTCGEEAFEREWRIGRSMDSNRALQEAADV
ncbi:MAG TPA: tetratricopeptide repeat protein [Candidatus Baltobacteraceae bacterium]|nr:tetratricopeptide repeat protein [Candidatus Baltobacteraceae bacterium]